jgi:hypothetical protein
MKPTSVQGRRFRRGSGRKRQLPRRDLLSGLARLCNGEKVGAARAGVGAKRHPQAPSAFRMSVVGPRDPAERDPQQQAPEAAYP